MEITNILLEKKEELLKTGNPLAVQFTVDEINMLADVEQLRYLKLQLTFPERFEPSMDLFDCVQRILEGDSDYRVLEFCVLKNRVLNIPVRRVFSRIIRG